MQEVIKAIQEFSARLVMVEAKQETILDMITALHNSVARVEQKQNELLGIVSEHVDDENDRWTLKKYFMQRVDKFIAKLEKRFLLFPDRDTKVPPVIK